MCKVMNDLSAHLKRYDANQARSEWLDSQANNDVFAAYFADAIEQIEASELSADDYQYLIDNGDVDGLSELGKQAIKDRAMDLAIEDGFSRYDE